VVQGRGKVQPCPGLQDRGPGKARVDELVQRYKLLQVHTDLPVIEDGVYHFQVRNGQAGKQMGEEGGKDK
jgi:hypothetical protein